MNQNQNPASTKIWPIRFPEETNAWLPSVSWFQQVQHIPTNQTPRNKPSGQSRQTNHSNQQTYSSHLKMSNNLKSGYKRKSSSPRFDCFCLFNLSHLAYPPALLGVISTTLKQFPSSFNLNHHFPLTLHVMSTSVYVIRAFAVKPDLPVNRLPQDQK
jgi:hypothetical protein